MAQNVQDTDKIRNIAIIAHVGRSAYEETKSFLIGTFGMNPNPAWAGPCLPLPNYYEKEYETKPR